jgi:hypothetical protein
VDAASRAVLADGRGLALVDQSVADAFDALEAERCISIALECLQQVGCPIFLRIVLCFAIVLCLLIMHRARVPAATRWAGRFFSESFSGCSYAPRLFLVT